MKSVLLWVLVAGWVATLFVPYDDTDPEKQRGEWFRRRSGLSIYVDAATGCQYLARGLFGGLTPRLNELGKPFCRKEQQ